MDRILATHTGSLIRPPELLAFLAAKERGQDFDEDAYQRTLRDAVDDVVRRQVEAGIDVLDDGEMGKATWITYLYERVSGLEVRPIQLEGASMLPPSRDRQAFPGAYAALDALDEAAIAREHAAASSARPTRTAPQTARAWPGSAPVRSPTTAPRSTATSPTSRRRSRGTTSSTRSSRWSRRRARTGSQNEYYPSEEEFVFALADALREEYRAIVDAGLLLQVDDAVLMHEADTMMSHGESWEDYRRWADLRVEALNHALRGPARGPRPLPRVLGQLARTARVRSAAARRRRPDPRT